MLIELKPFSSHHFFFLWLCFSYNWNCIFVPKNADLIFNHVDRMGTLTISCIIGLILTAITIQFLIEGVQSVLLSWNVIMI
ncbi:MAG: hypothetical protein KAJ44_02255 [Thermoplasmatales archaeon]|nr:hypothetical protein [Thermoplasmatales archaeon]